MYESRIVLLVNFPEDDSSKLNHSLQEEGLKVKKVPLIIETLRKKLFPSLILFNLEKVDMGSRDLFRKVKKIYPSVPVIIFSSKDPGEVEKNLKFIKEGAYDYIKKPFVIDELKIVIRKALRDNRRESFEKDYSSGFTLPSDFILGENPRMREIFNLLREIAPTDLTVLIKGESGTGKEMIASIIHGLSKRQKEPFLRLNCAALCESIMESELFGYERGAFTGADTKKIGLFSAAEGGTLLLDEIAQTSTNTQAKLLRVIENKEFIPVGGIAPVKCNVRLIVATNKNLEKEVREGRFLVDLYYRINTFFISLPPLRERKEDIPLFVNHFLKKHSRYFNKSIKGVSQEVYDFLINYPWPGNIRELESTVIKMIIVSKKSLITLGEVRKILPSRGCFAKDSFSSFEEAKRVFLNSFEKKYIEDLLIRCRGNVTAAARMAKVTRSFIYQKTRQYKIDLSLYRKNSREVLSPDF